MEVTQEVCEHCKIIEDHSFITNEKSFDELVDSIETKDINKLGTSGVIKWLLENTTPKFMDVFEIKQIVNKCVFCSESEIIEILKQYQVFVKFSSNDPNEELNKDMNERYAAIDAAYKGNPEIISWLLNLNCNKNISQQELAILLSYAINGTNKLENIKMLVSLGANLTQIFVDCSSIEKIAFHGYIEIIDWIVSNNLVQEEHIVYSYALHVAIKEKHYNVVKYLVENTKLDINAKARKEDKFKTVVHLAAEIGNINIILWLIEKGAKLFVGNNKKTIVNIAAINGHVNLLKWLWIQGGDIISPRSGGKTLLHLAAKKGHLDCVKYLVHEKFDVNATDQEKESVLHCAVASKKIELVKFLIDHGANVFVEDNSCSTLLHKAHDSLEMLQLLVSMGLDLNAKGSGYKPTVLNLAARCNNYEVVCWLLDQGMDITDVESVADEWLDTSYKNHDLRMLYLCIKYVKQSKEQKFHATLLVAAALHSETFQLLLQNNADFNVVCPNTGETPLMSVLRNINSSNPDYTVAMYLLNINISVTPKAKMLNWDALYIAITKKLNLAFIEKLLQLGGDANCKLCLSYTALGEAVSQSNLELVNLLLHYGADINDVDYSGYTVLYIASEIMNYNKPLIKNLISLGANPNYYNGKNKPMLYKACEMQDLEFISYLLKYATPVHLTVPTKGPIIFECLKYFTDESKKLQFITLLFNHGLDANIINMQEETLLFSCIEHLSIVEYLIKQNINVNYVNSNSRSALHEALDVKHYVNDSQNQIKVAIKLLFNGADIGIADASGITPLHLATSNKHCSYIARLMVQKGANVNARDLEGNSVLHVTCPGDLAIWLCEQGANIEAKNNQEVSVLQTAIQNLPEKEVSININIVPLLQTCTMNGGIKNKTATKSVIKSIEFSRYMKYLEFLVNQVKNVNEQDITRMTAMHYAVVKDNIFLVQLLFEKGVNILSKSCDGNTVLHSAASAGSLSVVTYILEHMKHELLLKGNNFNDTPLHLATISNHVNIVKLLLNHGVEVDYKNNKNMTALHFACRHGNLEIVKLLLANGANILYASNTYSYTAIHMSIGKYDIFKYLLQFESQIPNSESNVKLLDLKTDSGATLLHIAAICGISKNEPSRVIQYLINNKVYPIDVLDMQGNSPLHYACRTSLIGNIIFLVDNGANINLKNKTGNTPLHIAAKPFCVDVIKYLLLNGGNAIAKNKKGNTPVHISASFKKASRYMYLFTDNISEDILYIKNRKGNSVIHLAAASDCGYLVEITNCNILNQKNQSPLVFGILHSSLRGVKFNTTKEVINTIDIYGNTPLQLLVSRPTKFKFLDYCAIVERLCTLGADLTLKNKSGNAAVHMAFHFLAPEIVATIIIPYVTDANVTNEYGFNVLHMALNSTLELPVIKKLFETADLNAKTNQGETYLHVAINEHPRDIVLNWLVPKCKKIINEVENVHGDTVLLKCIRNNRDLSTIQLLVDNGADIHAVDSANQSVLHLAVLANRFDLSNYFLELINSTDV